MKEEYFKELEQKINELGLADGKDILKKYEHYYDLAIEAGFSEEEALSKLGNVDDILSKYQNVVNTRINKSKLNLKLSIIAGDIDISPIKEDRINVNASDKFYEYYEIINDESGLDIHLKNDKILKKNIDDDLTIEIGENLLFDEVSIALTSADLNSSYVFNCENCKITSVSGDANLTWVNANQNVVLEAVSGDIQIESIKAINIKVDEVSGDVDIKNVDCENLKLNSVSGDMEISGKADNVKGNSISGDICFNDIKHNSLKENIKDKFSKWKNKF